MDNVYDVNVKVKEVLRGCNKPHHIPSARRYLKNFLLLYKIDRIHPIWWELSAEMEALEKRVLNKN